MRLTQTGTGRGQIVGRGRLDFCAQQDRAIRSGSVSWEDDTLFVPLLPGLAFDQYFPNLRSMAHDGKVLSSKDTVQATLRDFEEWVDRARERFDAGESLPLFESLPLASAAPGEHIAESAELVVRLNQSKKRLWGETTYASLQGRELLFHVVHELFWNWCASHDRGVCATMLSALECQFDYYDVHGVPSDFMMRQIGRAPYAAWQDL
jgi:hypothetical protein